MLVRIAAAIRHWWDEINTPVTCRHGVEGECEDCYWSHIL